MVSSYISKAVTHEEMVEGGSNLDRIILKREFSNISMDNNPSLIKFPNSQGKCSRKKGDLKESQKY